MSKEKFLKDAIASDPEGAICFWCKQPNTFCDDIGWFYIEPYGKAYAHEENRRKGNHCKPACQVCHDGPLGDMHRAKYGIGDR